MLDFIFMVIGVIATIIALLIIVAVKLGILKTEITKEDK